MGKSGPLTTVTQPEHLRAQQQHPALLAIIASTLAVIAGELLLANGMVAASATVHATLIILLTAYFVHLSGARRDAETPANRTQLASLLSILMLVPLLRLLSVTLSIRELPQEFRYVLIGSPMLFAIALAAQYLGWTRVNFAIHSWKLQGVIGLSGIPIGIIGALGFPFLSSFAAERRTGGELILYGIVLIIFAGVLEELIFRGLLQSVLVKQFGGLGSIWTNTLFAALYLSAPTPLYALYMFFVGLYFSYCVRVSRSLWGVMLAHSLATIIMVIVAPLLSGS